METETQNTAFRKSHIEWRATQQEESKVEATLWTERETAKYLQLSPRTVFALAKDGRLKRVKIGNSVRYDPADVRAFVEACKLAV